MLRGENWSSNPISRNLESLDSLLFTLYPDNLPDWNATSLEVFKDTCELEDDIVSIVDVVK